LQSIIYLSGLRASSEESQANKIRLNNFATEETSNLMTMKRLSFPNYNLTNKNNKSTPPFMGHTAFAHTYFSHLDTATKFGPVVKGLRKPGHHIPGPARNPHCPCDHCRQHFYTEEPTLFDGGRSRAFSLSNADHLSSCSSKNNCHNNSSSFDSLNII
jgi:hypothetical protein